MNFTPLSLPYFSVKINELSSVIIHSKITHRSIHRELIIEWFRFRGKKENRFSNYG